MFLGHIFHTRIIPNISSNYDISTTHPDALGISI